MADRCHHEMKKPTINFVDAVHTIILKRLKRKRFLTVKVDGLTRIEIAVKLMDDNINVSKRYLAMNISPDFRRTLEKNISAMEQTRASIIRLNPGLSDLIRVLFKMEGLGPYSINDMPPE